MFDTGNISHTDRPRHTDFYVIPYVCIPIFFYPARASEVKFSSIIQGLFEFFACGKRLVGGNFG